MEANSSIKIWLKWNLNAVFIWNSLTFQSYLLCTMKKIIVFSLSRSQPKFLHHRPWVMKEKEIGWGSEIERRLEICHLMLWWGLKRRNKWNTHLKCSQELKWYLLSRRNIFGIQRYLWPQIHHNFWGGRYLSETVDSFGHYHKTCHNMWKWKMLFDEGSDQVSRIIPFKGIIHGRCININGKNKLE